MYVLSGDVFGNVDQVALSFFPSPSFLFFAEREIMVQDASAVCSVWTAGERLRCSPRIFRCRLEVFPPPALPNPGEPGRSGRCTIWTWYDLLVGRFTCRFDLAVPVFRSQSFFFFPAPLLPFFGLHAPSQLFCGTLEGRFSGRLS